jgi:hypothetical protein
VYYSGEARWFFQGEASHAARHWITAGDLSDPAPERVDQYLVLPGCSTTGVKIREGNFEVKAQTSPPEPVTWNERIAGSRDTWVKWSRAMQDTATFTDRIQSGERVWPAATERGLATSRPVVEFLFRGLWRAGTNPGPPRFDHQVCRCRGT